MIQVDGLQKQYGDQDVLNGISFQVFPGEICAFLGPNGAGKSTTVKILTGTLNPTAGKVCVGGFDVSLEPIEVKKRIGYVPENAYLYSTLSVQEYLALVGTFHKIPSATIAERSNKMLELFEISAAMNQRIGTLSKGMRQKVLITGALIHDPEVLLFDEPLSGLDANATQVVKEVITEMASRGKTILYCSHLLDIVERLCSRAIVIAGGKIIAGGTPKEVMKLTGTETLERAFQHLTGGHDHQQEVAAIADVVSRKSSR